MTDWHVIYDKKKNEYFAVENKHKGVTPKMIGKNEVVGVCSFKHANDAIDYIKFIHSHTPMRRRK